MRGLCGDPSCWIEGEHEAIGRITGTEVERLRERNKALSAELERTRAERNRLAIELDEIKARDRRGVGQLMNRKYVISLESLSALPHEAQQDLMDTIKGWFERTGQDDCLKHLGITSDVQRLRDWCSEVLPNDEAREQIREYDAMLRNDIA